MPGAINLAGNVAATQPCIIVSKPGSHSIYYEFTIDLANKPDNKGLSYSIIDMGLRGGMGDATGDLNISLEPSVCNKITAVNNRDNSGVWVIVHKWESADFYAYLIDKAGIMAPVVSVAGSVHGGNYADNIAFGYMKASPDGTRLALAIMGMNKVELFDFNNNTGTVSNPRSFSTTDAGVQPYGLEFSSDSKKLFLSLVQSSGGGPPANPSKIYQFDISGGLLTNPALIISTDGIRLGAMQLGPDSRIYISRTVNQFLTKDSLDVIYNPTRLGTACNFNQLETVQDSRFWLAGRPGLYSLPNFNQSYFNLPAFTWDSVCKGQGTKFKITNRANLGTVQWDFGDGGTSNTVDPTHAFAKPGPYRVKLTENFNGEAFSDSALVTSYPLPSITLVDTVLLYAGSTINLHAGGGFSEYLWSTGSGDSIINVGSQGTYWAQVKDIHCCINADTTFVKVFEYLVPNAFSPNGDNLNDVFSVLGLYDNINFSMVIYDRWGKLVFQSNNIHNGWDGRAGGQYCPPDSYVWIVKIGFLGKDIITQGDVVFKGTVTIIR